MTKTLPVLAGLLLMTSLIVPLASAHGAPPPPSHFTRLLHDHNDDSLFLTAQGISAFDSIALDGTVGYNGTAGEPELILRMTLNNGCTECEWQTQAVEVTTPAGPQVLDFTTDGEAQEWTGTMDWYSAPIDINDGTRFAVEGGIRLSAIGAQVSDDLTDWFVTATNSQGPGDDMPYGLNGEPDMFPNTDGSFGLAYNIGTYTLPPVDFYATLEADVRAIELDGEESTFTLTLTNLLDIPQEFAITATGPHGVHVILDTPTIGLAGGNATDIAMRLHNMAETDAEGTLNISATSSAHGHAALSLPVTVQALAPAVDGEGGAGFDSGELAPGGSYAWKFTEAGTYPYHDDLFPTTLFGTITVGDGHGVHEGMDADGMDSMDDGMEGDHMESHDQAAVWTIRVVEDGIEANQADWRLDPADLTIAVGDIVVWENTGQLPHRFAANDASGHEHVHTGHGDHDHGTESDAAIPGVGPLALLGMLVLVGIATRKRS